MAKKQASKSSKSRKMKKPPAAAAQKRQPAKPKEVSVTPGFIDGFAGYLTRFGTRTLEGRVYAAEFSDAMDGIALGIAGKSESGPQIVGAWEYIRLHTIHREREQCSPNYSMNSATLTRQSESATRRIRRTILWLGSTSNTVDGARRALPSLCLLGVSGELSSPLPYARLLARAASVPQSR